MQEKLTVISTAEELKTQPKTISIRAVASLSLPWKDYLEKQYIVWEAATRLHNGLIWELFQRDTPPWRNGTDMRLLPTKETFGAPLSSLAYQLSISPVTGLNQFGNVLPSSSLASMSVAIATVYANKRRGAMQHMNDSLPLKKFPAPMSIPVKEVELEIDPENQAGFIVSFPLLRPAKGVVERVVLRLRQSANDRNTSGKDKKAVVKGSGVMPQVPLLEKLRTGVLKMGAITVSGERRHVSSSEAKKLPIRRDARGNRYVYEPVIGFSVYFPVAPFCDRKGLVLIHTDPSLFLVARVSHRTKWNLNEDHVRKEFNVLSPAEMRAVVEEHDLLVHRLREDAKALDRGSRSKSEAICNRHARRLKNFINNMVKISVENVKRMNFAEVAFFCGDAYAQETYMPHFPWFVFCAKLKLALAAEHIEFNELVPFDFMDCKQNGAFDYTKIYLKLRARKASQTKRDVNITQRNKKEEALFA